MGSDNRYDLTSDEGKRSGNLGAEQPLNKDGLMEMGLGELSGFVSGNYEEIEINIRKGKQINVGDLCVLRNEKKGLIVGRNHEIIGDVKSVSPKIQDALIKHGGTLSIVITEVHEEKRIAIGRVPVGV